MRRPLGRNAVRRLSTIGDRVGIPQALVSRLTEKFGSAKRFILIGKPVAGDPKTGKSPFERGWQNRPYDDENEKLQAHLRNGGNYGVVAGGGLFFVDTDDAEAGEMLMEARRGDTLTVQTGSGSPGKLHFYFDGVGENGILTREDGAHLGEVRARNQQVIGPGSRHWTGGRYKIVKDAPIAHLSKDELQKIFGSRLKWAREQLAEDDEAAEEECGKDEIPIGEIISLEGFAALGGGELQGAHPLHGSTTGKNFNVNLKKNRWHCFRHSTGGGPLSLIAVISGLIECGDVRRGALTGNLKREALQIAKEKYGFEVDVPIEELTPDISRFFKEDLSGRMRFMPARVAFEMMNETPYLTQITRMKEGAMFRYDKEKGIYQPDALSYINAQVAEKLGEHYDINKESQVEAFIRAKTYREIPEANKELIATKNGVLNVATLEFHPFSPEFYIFNAVPVVYDPKAKCELFMQKLSEWTSEDGQLLLQEHVGSALYKDNTRFQRALMLTGLRQNGKSTFLHAVRAMLGADNVSAVALDILGDSGRRFVIAQLYNRLANICADIPPKPMKETDTFKKAVAGDLLEGEFKFQQAFQFVPYAKLFFSANELPPMTGKDVEAFMVRWDIVDFPNSFLPGDPRRDPELLRKLTTPGELSGMLNWALEGLRRLLDRGHFSDNLTLEEKAKEWSIRADAVKVFTEERVVGEFEATPEEKDAGPPTARDLYGEYAKFCRKHGTTPISANMFTRRFKGACQVASQRRTSATKGGRKEYVWVWEGVRLRSEGQERLGCG